MPTPELRRLYEVGKRMDLLRAMKGWDTPESLYLFEVDDTLRLEAETMLTHEGQGRKYTYRLEVIVDTLNEMSWAPQPPRYVAVTPQAGLQGCIHWVESTSLAQARRDAVTAHEHRQHCGGRGQA